jgi:hypothetical protein
MKIATLALIGAMPVLTADTDDGFDAAFFRAGFQTIRPGMTEARVLGRVGVKPEAEERSRILGVSVVRWRWGAIEGNTAYVVTFLAHWVVSTKTCSKTLIAKC